MPENFVPNTQVLRVPFSEDLRVCGYENAVRTNKVTVKGEEKLVMNIACNKYASDGDDDSAPVTINLILWERMAEAYEGLIEPGMFISASGIATFRDNTYEKEGQVFPKFQVDLSINNKRQIKVCPKEALVAPNSTYSADTETPSTKPSAKSVVDSDDIPF